MSDSPTTEVPAPLSADRLKQLAALAVISGIGNGVALKTGGFVLARLKASAIGVTSTVEGAVGAALYFGMLVGSFASGQLSHSFGRRPAILGGELLTVLVSVAFCFIPSSPWAIFWRAALGFAMGFCRMAKPLYLSECTPSLFRGRILSLFIALFPVGFIMTELIDWLPDRGSGSYPDWWRLEILLGGCATLLMPLSCPHRHIAHAPQLPTLPHC